MVQWYIPMRLGLRLTLALAAIALVGRLVFALAEPTAHGGVLDADHPTVERFLSSDSPPLISYRARRVLEASTRSGKLSASLEVWTSRDDAGRFFFEVIRTTGSGLIRQHVLLPALEEEQRIENQRTGEEAALSRLNYAFTVSGGAADPLVRIEITPHRASTFLLTGAIFVTPDTADLVRVEGRLSKRPSFWTRSVTIMRRYERIQGVRVPVEMRSMADIRLVGASSFSMNYKYEMINGERVGDAADSVKQSW
jgi:hypothetical protein